ncbi:MAG: NAD(P)-dependent alcohol dehydrogenase [Candidatus Promineifilaceae bacterium]|jgi:NADPH:quinone reductase-like Zn-dependent oxidoreductase
MKAMVYTQYGPPEVLQFMEVEKPTPAEDEVLVEVRASSLNFGDVALLKGSPAVVRFSSGLRKPKYPILGGDVTGRIVGIGRHVRRFQPGDEVFADIGSHGFGAYAEYVAVPEKALALKPANASFAEAGAAPQAAVVALQGLRDSSQVQAGQKVLINGASGGIGPYAVQIAKAFGAHVSAVCSTANLDFLRSIGADEVIDYTAQDFTQSGQTYDVIFDIVANRSVSDYARVLTPEGAYVACAFNATSLFLGPLISRTGNKKIVSLIHKPNTADLLVIKELFEESKIVSVIDSCFPLAELATAVRHWEEENPRGKVVITVE